MKKFSILVIALVSFVNAQIFHISELTEGHPMRETRLRQIEELTLFYVNEYRKGITVEPYQFDSVRYKVAKDHSKHLEYVNSKIDPMSKQDFIITHNRGYKVNGVYIANFAEHCDYYGINSHENISLQLVADSIDVDFVSNMVVYSWSRSTKGHREGMSYNFKNFAGISCVFVKVKKRNRYSDGTFKMGYNVNNYIICVMVMN
jgi:uncharacterized protein YkwD